MSPFRRRLIEFGVAVVAVGVALLIRWPFDPLVGDRLAFPTIVGAVAIAVAFGGLYPALVATVLGYVGGSWFFVEPRGTLRHETASDWFTLIGYLIVCLTVTLLGTLMRAARHRHQVAAQALAEVNQRKDELLATVAHELRNPLGPIRAAVGVLRNSTTGREVSLAHDMIDRQVDHLTRLVDDLVAMDRIARGELKMQVEHVSLRAILERAVEASRSLTAHHEFQVRLPKEPLYLEADGVRLEQVFVNLITNAVKFTPPGGSIFVAAVAEDGQVKVLVKDSGVGISQDAMPRIFEMFYQSDSTQRGLGIGLALVRQLVTLHGGAVSAHSKGPGCGSEFVVRLTLCAEQESGHGVEAVPALLSPAESQHSIPVS